MKIELGVRRKGKLIEYKNVFTVSLNSKEKNMHRGTLKSKVSQYVKNNISAKEIEITPVWMAENKEMITVVLASTDKLLFIIYK